MNAGVVSGSVTAALLVLFVVGWIRLYAAHRRDEFEAAARLAFEPDTANPSTSTEQEPIA